MKKKRIKKLNTLEEENRRKKHVVFQIEENFYI